MTSQFTYEALVLGLGNILWADEGFGVRAVEAFHATYQDRADVHVLDGGTLGAYLMNAVMESRRLLILDCCELKAEPGTLKVLRGDEIKTWSSTKISAHQTGMNDVLAKAMVMGYEPEKITVIGVQPCELEDYGGSLTPRVRAHLIEAVELAAQELAAWNLPVEKRPAGEKVTSLSFDSLGMTLYEENRPSEESAPREGDTRFMPRKEN